MIEDIQLTSEKILQILSQLISFQSITPKGKDIIYYIESILKKTGFNCEIKTFGSNEEETINLYATYGTTVPNICFAGHVDVVPPAGEDKWSYPPFVITNKDEKIYGRGTVDMKGSIACSLVAVLNYLEKNSNPRGMISFLLTSDEEGSGKYGTKIMLEYITNKFPKIDYCILGEPTSKNHIGDTIKIGRRGSINCNLVIHGIQGHAAYPEKALNPILITIKILNHLIDVQWDQGEEFFQPTNLEITSIDVDNPTVNVIPNLTMVKFNIRFNTLHTTESLTKKIYNIIALYTNNFEFTYTTTAEPFIQKLSDNTKVFAAITEQVTGIKPNIETSGGTSDARFIHQYTDVVEFGLKSDLAHKIDEYTEIRDLQILYSVYYNCLIKFLGD